MPLPTVIYAVAVAIGLLLAGSQLVALYRRPPRLPAEAATARHRRSGRAQTVKERHAAWHTFRVGMLSVFGGAIGIASRYHTVSLWLVLVVGCAVVLVWDRALWLRQRQQQAG
jgi:hypothetical protein